MNEGDTIYGVYGNKIGVIKMDRPYGFLEPDTKLENVIRCLNAKQDIDLWVLNKYTDTFENKDKERKINVRYVYQLYENWQPIMEFVVDYMRFNYDRLTIIIKPNKWMEIKDVK